MAVNTGRVVGSFGPAKDAEGGEREIITPFVFFEGVFTMIPTRQETSEATGVNPDGIIVGRDSNVRFEDATDDAWVRKSNGTLEYLPELSDGHSSAQGINRSGTIAGFSQASDGRIKAVIWRPR